MVRASATAGHAARLHHSRAVLTAHFQLWRGRAAAAAASRLAKAVEFDGRRLLAKVTRAWYDAAQNRRAQVCIWILFIYLHESRSL